MVKILNPLLIALSLATSLSTKADLPVIDFTAAANAMQEIQAWGQQAQQMQQEIQTLEQQLQQIQMLYTSVTGGPNSLKNLANLGNNAAYYQYLPKDYQQILQSGYAGWQAVNQANQWVDAGKTGVSGNSLQAVTPRAMQISSNVGMMQAAYTSAAQRLANLMKLLNQIDETPDAKSIADLQGRIQAEQTLLQNEQTRLQLLGQMADLQRDQESQRAQQAALAGTGGLIPKGW